MALTWNEAIDRWQDDGGTPSVPDLVFNTYDALPAPNTVDAGTRAVVLSGEPRDALRGPHIAIGPAGGMGEYWRAE